MREGLRGCQIQDDQPKDFNHRWTRMKAEKLRAGTSATEQQSDETTKERHEFHELTRILQEPGEWRQKDLQTETWGMLMPERERTTADNAERQEDEGRMI